MEDAQPNEVRLSRKGSTSIPLVRATSKKHKKWTKDHRDNARINRQHPITKARESNVPGPSRINIAPRPVVACARCPDKQSLNLSSASSKPVSSTSTMVRSHHMHTVHAKFSSRQRPAVRTVLPTESIIDLTLDPPSPPAGNSPARWSTFRSGHIDISILPSRNDSRTSDPRPVIQQDPTYFDSQRQYTSSVRRNNTGPHIAQPNITNDTVRLMEGHRMGRSHSDQFRRLDALEVACSSLPSVSPAVLEGEAEISPSSPHYSPLIHTSTCGNLSLSLGSYDRPRRLLPYNDSALVVTAHGTIDQVRTTDALSLDRNIRLPALPLEEFVDDACILTHQGEPVIILGHAREHSQITVLNLKRGQIITLLRDRTIVKKPGASAVTSLMSPLNFATGGYDHRVHLWDISQDFSGASPVELAIKHASVVHSLLPIMDTSHKLISVGADRQVHIYDMSQERVVHTFKMSCTPFHAHKTEFRSCTLLEVSHLETQFELYDHRTSHQPVQRFGFITEERRGRYERADTWSHFVVCGDKNGTVHLWDLRNVSTKVTLSQCFNDPVMQVVKTSSRLLACSKRNELAYIDFSNEA